MSRMILFLFFSACFLSACTTPCTKCKYMDFTKDRQLHYLNEASDGD
ncbi:MAG TPA: hypothetical protein VJK30_05820 [Coxiellaceae bacterium]|nr:hypothetical protein [Coxiellaceae bacterium]